MTTSSSNSEQPSRRPPADLLAGHMAGEIVKAMKEISGVALDYTPDSIVHIDKLLHSFQKQGITGNKVQHILFQAGCYVGQVFIKNHPNFRWMHPDEVLPALDKEMFPFPVVQQVPRGMMWAPINKAHAVLHDPESNSLHFSYRGWSAEAASSKK